MPPRMACMLRAYPLLYVACVRECGQTARKTSKTLTSAYNAGPQAEGQIRASDRIWQAHVGR